MSTLDINKMEGEEENKTPDKKQIEAEEKEVMLKTESENNEINAEIKADGEGLVKAALSQEVIEQGREVKPKFIPIGAIKMPGFFTRNSDKPKDDEVIEKDPENEKTEESKPKRNHFQFLHTCPFTKFLHHPTQNDKDGTIVEEKKGIHLPKINVDYQIFFQKRSNKDPEATLASMETLEDKLDTPNDGMENVKLDPEEAVDGKVATKLPFKERIRQKKFIIDDLIVGAVVVLVLLAVLVGVLLGARAGPATERPLRLGRYMTTLSSCGPVEGILEEGVYKFYSIPYAVPPIGDLRFTYAQPLNNISLCWNGTLQNHKPGPLCMQFKENERTIIGEEDCLTLDVVTPHVRYDSRLPVVVLIGAGTLAGGISPAQPSALYARTKEVVFVRPNFRLGPFGFLALDILSKTIYPETSGNYGLSDLLVALRWVKLNIQHFGGDPDSVTLLGHRAGATLAALLTTVPKAQKLYSRAFLSSGSVIFPGKHLKDSYPLNEEFKQNSKCNDAACLRRMKPEAVMTAVPATWLGSDVGSLPKTNEMKHSWLVLDGVYVTRHAFEAWDVQKESKETGKERAFKPMVFGTTAHSGHSDLLRMKHLNWTAEHVESVVNDSVIGDKNLTASVYGHVNRTYSGLVELVSAVRTLCPLVSLARLRLGAPLYVVAGAGAGAAGSRLAGVDADLEAILGTFDSEVVEQRRFMAAMQQLFYYFVWNGRLPGPETGIAEVGQDVLPLHGLPLCDLLIREDIVPRYAHVD
ncbi:neurotactin isoform X1 [Cydia pomonella]|uniref:neurotactin isoform X1 n=1 Tax=Cydia pomonella TaxID=82600 RepID=UPI002ADE6B15|nr:neurotactin isoform X1 [Cydia pomonella]